MSEKEEVKNEWLGEQRDGRENNHLKEEKEEEGGIKCHVHLFKTLALREQTSGSD